MSKDELEIEKKFILNQMPAQDLINHNIPHESYYLTGATDSELRLVKRSTAMGFKYSISVKNSGGLIRKEWEDNSFPEWAFEALLKDNAWVPKLTKTRHYIDDGNNLLEIDEYFGDLKGLVILECEFKSEEEANKFIVPEWLDVQKEVTEDNRYKNKNLAVFGIPVDKG